MFVVFEGIDGSGKTTISNQVAAKIRASGISLTHVREGGEFSSPLVTRLREFGKDARNVTLQAIPEMLLYLARETQLFAESVAPALQEADIVFADRYFYSYEVLAVEGRGVSADLASRVVQAVAQDVWPELVILLDVDPHIARARRKVAKLAMRKDEESPAPSRKGMVGVGLKQRLRNGYLQRAKQDPTRWHVFDNTGPDSSLDDLVEQITALVLAKFHQKPVAPHREITQPALAVVQTPHDVEQKFFDLVERRARKEPMIAAHLLSGMQDPRAFTMLEAMADRAPQIVAYAVSGLGDERAWLLRERLSEVAPYAVARSLDPLLADQKRTWTLRHKLWDVAPRAVLSSISGHDDQAAWELREKADSRYLGSVLASLVGIIGGPAQQLREKAFDKKIGPGEALGLLRSLRGLSDEFSWKIRDHLLPNFPVLVLESLTGVLDNRSWQLRQDLVAFATRSTFKTLRGVTDDRAWQMRERFASLSKEVFDSIQDLDEPRAWHLRSSMLDLWPSTVVKSTGSKFLSEPGQALAQKALAKFPDNISLLKHVTQLSHFQGYLMEIE